MGTENDSKVGKTPDEFMALVRERLKEYGLTPKDTYSPSNGLFYDPSLHDAFKRPGIHGMADKYPQQGRVWHLKVGVDYPIEMIPDSVDQSAALLAAANNPRGVIKVNGRAEPREPCCTGEFNALIAFSLKDEKVSGVHLCYGPGMDSLEKDLPDKPLEEGVDTLFRVLYENGHLSEQNITH